MLNMANSSSSVVEQSTDYHLFKGSNPGSTGTGKRVNNMIDRGNGSMVEELTYCSKSKGLNLVVADTGKENKAKNEFLKHF